MNDATRNVLFSSKTDTWETPQWFFEDLNREFCFKTDVCALPENAKCERYFTPEQGGLQEEWHGVCWCNPPYGRSIESWVKKAHDSARENGATVVMLLPARTDTKWFHRYIYGKAEIRFVQGRLKFGGQKKTVRRFRAWLLFSGARRCRSRRRRTNEEGYNR